MNLDSQGTVLLRKWLTRDPYTETYLGQSLFSEPFDGRQPLNTPAGLAGVETALDKLAEAVL